MIYLTYLIFLSALLLFLSFACKKRSLQNNPGLCFPTLQAKTTTMEKKFEGAEEYPICPAVQAGSGISDGDVDADILSAAIRTTPVAVLTLGAALFALLF
jgi:hypothetical protein